MLLKLQSQKAPEMVPSDALSETVFHWMLLFSIFVSSIGKNHVIFTLMYLGYFLFVTRKNSFFKALFIILISFLAKLLINILYSYGTITFLFIYALE